MQVSQNVRLFKTNLKCSYEAVASKRRSSLLPNEDCYPLQGSKRKVHFYADDEEEKTEITDVTASSDTHREPFNPIGNSCGNSCRTTMRNGSDHLPSYGPHTMVNRSDSEKLSDVKSLFKSEVPIQNLYPADVANSLNKTLDNKSVNLDDIELFDVGQSPFWRPRSEQDDAVMPSYSRRRSVVAPIEDGDRMPSYGTRRDSSRGLLEANGSSEDFKENILEILREIVRKCSNADPGKRPTAHELLAMLNVKSNFSRDK